MNLPKPEHVSESVRKLNPHLYGNHNSVRQLPRPVEERDPAQALVGGDARKAKGDRRVAGSQKPVCRVVIVCLVGRVKDDDNPEVKWLRDEIARSLGLDDNQRFVEWEVHQVCSRERGTIVHVAML